MGAVVAAGIVVMLIDGFGVSVNEEELVAVVSLPVEASEQPDMSSEAIAKVYAHALN
jgi:hypothetical protein